MAHPRLTERQLFWTTTFFLGAVSFVGGFVVVTTAIVVAFYV